MQVVQRPFGGSALVRDYLEGAPAAARFYAGSPFDAESYRRKAQRFDRTDPARASAAASMIRPVGPRASALLKDVAAAPGYFVTTGQQPGLFGGPLYTLYKALSAARLAEDLGRLLDKPVMPLFWIASEDHDWEEAAQAGLLDGANELRRLDLGPEPGLARRALAETPLGPAAEDLVAHFAAFFPRNDFHARYVGLLRESLRPEATLASAFAALMSDLLADFPIGLVDAADPAVKAASRSLLQAEAEDPVASEAALAETAAELREAGYGLQVPLIPGASNLFLHGDSGRDRLLRVEDGGPVGDDASVDDGNPAGAGDRLDDSSRVGASARVEASSRVEAGSPVGYGYRLRRSGRELTARQVLEAIAADPCVASPNVLLRPVVESALFPTLAYVGGPGELAYFGQLGRLFGRHGLTMPVVVPRASFVVVERKVAKVLQRFDLEVDDVRDLDGLLGRFAKEGTPGDVKRAMERWRRTVDEAAKEMTGAAVEVDPTLKGAVAAARNAGFGALGALEKKIARAVKHRHETEWSQLAKASSNLWPGGKPQERTLGPLQYVMRYGPGFVALVRDELRPAIEVDRVAPAPPEG